MLTESIKIEDENQKLLYRNQYLHLHSIGRTKETQNSIFITPFCLDDYLFTIISSGEYSYSKSNESEFTETSKPYTMVIFRPGERIILKNNMPSERLWFHVLGYGVENILEKLSIDSKSKAVPLTKKQYLTMFSYHNELMSSIQNKEYTDLKSISYLLSIFSTLENMNHKINSISPSPSHSVYFEKSIEYIKENFRSNIEIQTLSDIAHLNKFYYIKQFKARYNSTPHQYILNKRIESAAIDLLNPDYKIDEVSSRNGFLNRTHFSQVFKKAIGCSPIEFRKNNSKRDFNYK